MSSLIYHEIARRLDRVQPNPGYQRNNVSDSYDGVWEKHSFTMIGTTYYFIYVLLKSDVLVT